MIRLACQRCEHEWTYKGADERYASCPHCYTKVRLVVVLQEK